MQPPVFLYRIYMVFYIAKVTNYWISECTTNYDKANTVHIQVNMFVSMKFSRKETTCQ